MGGEFQKEVEAWPTPIAGDAHLGSTQDAAARRLAEGKVTLSRAVESAWQTPTGTDAVGRDYTYPNGDHSKPFLTLVGQAQAQGWATPTTRDWKDGACETANVPTNALLGRQAPRITTDGLSSLSSTPTSRRLSPRFVEWLMGLPLGWTAFAPVGTEWSRWQRLMRGELSRLGWESLRD